MLQKTCLRGFMISVLTATVLLLPGCANKLGLPAIAFPGTKSASAQDKDKSKEKKEKKARKAIPDPLREDLENNAVIFVRDHAFVAYTHLVPVTGFGLVINLPGTGGNEPPGLERDSVMRELRKRDVPRPFELLSDPSTAVVRIDGFMREGIAVDDTFDITVCTPLDSETRSLRGGWLMPTPLSYMEYGEDGQLKTGKTVAYAQGPILVNPNADEHDNPGDLLIGKVLGGARATEARHLGIVMKPDSESEAFTARIAKEINHRFFVPGTSRGVADAKTEKLIELKIHPSYRDNIPRYLRIIQSIAMYETPQKQMLRLEMLREMLLRPETSAEASFQLEAIGSKAIPVLKEGLQSDDEEVRFCAGVALAYLNDSSAATILGQVARDVPAFRTYAFDALGTMQMDFEAERVLHELLHENSIETRYGAFRALWQRNPRDPVISGENLRGQFHYHQIVTRGVPVVHLADSLRPEIVLFSTDIRLQGRFALEGGPYTLVENGSTANADIVTVTKFPRDGIGMPQQRQTTNRLDDIIRTVVILEGTYPDVVQILHEAKNKGHLTCQLVSDKLPEGGRVYRRRDSSTDKEEEETPKPKRKVLDTLNPKTWIDKSRDKNDPDYYRSMDSDPRE